MLYCSSFFLPLLATTHHPVAPAAVQSRQTTSNVRTAYDDSVQEYYSEITAWIAHDRVARIIQEY